MVLLRVVEEAEADEHAGEMQDHQHRRGLAVKPEGQWQRRRSRATVGMERVIGYPSVVWAIGVGGWLLFRARAAHTRAARRIGDIRAFFRRLR